jgi:4-hydroxybenzoyl-CoA thioesterase
MPRIKIALPERFAFSTELPIYIGHINYGHHLDNAQLIALVAEARVRFLKSMGYGELDIEGLGIVVADVAAQYRSEAFHGETLLIEMAADDFGPYGCDFVWKVSDKATGREVARGKHGIVFFDYAARSKAHVPAAFQARFA